MALTFATLRAKLLEDTHRQELGDAKASEFIRYAEGVIARRLRCAEMITRTTLDDADRASATTGYYTLPGDYLEERSLTLMGSNPVGLEKASFAELREYRGSMPPRLFAVVSATELEVKGVPGAGAELELIYFARPAALTADSDTNEILTRHEAIYLMLGAEALYSYTQDRELARDAADLALSAIEGLNEQAGRLMGGQRTAGGYNFNTCGGY